MAGPDPFGYANAFRPGGTPAPQPVGDPMLQAMQDDRDREQRMQIILSPPPEQVAKASQIARDNGLPPSAVEGQIDEAQKALNARKTTTVLGQYPAFTGWAINNPRGMVAASDDHANLGIMGSLWQSMKGLRDAAASGLYTGTATAWRAAGNVVRYFEPGAEMSGMGEAGLAIDRTERQGIEQQAAARQAGMNTQAAGLRATGQALMPANPTLPQRVVAGGTSMVPAMVGGAINPFLGAGVFAQQGYDDAHDAAFAAAKKRGLTDDQAEAVAHAAGTENGVISGLLGLVPGAKIVGKIAAPVAEKFGISIAEQGLARVAVNSAQRMAGNAGVIGAMQVGSNAVAEANGEADRPLLEGVGQAMVEGALAGELVHGSMHAGGAAVDAARRLVRPVVDSAQGLAEGDVLSRLGTAAEESKLRGRDPVAFADLMRRVGEESGVTHAYIPGERVREYMQSDAFDPERDPFAGMHDEVNEAAASGGDVVLPIERLMTDLPGTKAWGALKDEIRLSPDGMSPNEARALQDQIGAIHKELTDQAEKVDAAEQSNTDARAKIVERVTRLLQDAGYTPFAASQQAELIAAREATRAARLGRDLTGDEFGTDVRQVLPPALEAARAADQTDLVINALRKGGDASVQGGKSLLEFIASRGGVEDPGGDLKAMGADKWHREKAFRKRLLAETTSTQGNMIGGGEARDRSQENTFDAAISEGYFPETYAAREAGGKPDLNEFHAAIADELRGSPRYAEEARVDPVRAAAEELRRLLEDRGLDPSAMSDKEVRAAIDGLSREASGGRIFHEGPRGQIQFEDGKTTIQLFESRNLSTLVHELGHQYLEELSLDASLPDAPEQLRADWQTVTDWLKRSGHDLSDGIPTDAHELFARSFERYLMEGKAPSSALARVFETFRSWLVSIYKTVAGLNAPITPEVREVMDRLIATDDEIATQRQAQALEPAFKDAETAGMTGEEFAAYTRQLQGARDAANSELLAKTMASIRAREQKRYREQRVEVEREMTQMVDDGPVMRAIRAMKDTPLDKAWIDDRMGVDAKDLLPKRVPPLVREGGAHPDDIAEQAGYQSGRDMIEALIGAEKVQREAKAGGDKRTMRERMIGDATDAEMKRRYGDPFTDGSIEREAIAAVNNEKQGELLATEIRYLGRKTGQRPTPYRVAREWARGKIRGGEVGAEASPGSIARYARNVAKAGREAEKAILAGKMEEAFAAKQRQMLSSALLAEAKEAYDAVSKARRYMDRIARARTMKSVDQDYLEQAHALLEGVDLKERTAKSVERFGKWEAWANAREAEGFDVVVPPSFEAMIGNTHWTKLSVENLLGLSDAVRQVMHLGKLKQTLLDGQEVREREAVIAEARDGAGNIKGPPPKGLSEPGWLDSIRSRVASIDAALLKMETVFDWLDGGNPNGVFNRVVFRPVSEAQNAERAMHADYLAKMKALFEAVPGEQVRRWNDRETLPFTDPYTGQQAVVTRQKLIAMALNIGNEGNLQRLSDGYGWNADAIQRHLNETLTAEEWRFVQGTWDLINTLWPHIEALEKRVNGVAPDKVEARAFETPHGRMEGGYYPAVYDGTLDLKAEEDRGRNADLFQSNYTKANTRSSATKDRSDAVRRPILLDLGVINRHLAEVIHDVTHREAVIQAHSFLTDARVAAIVEGALGPAIRGQMRPWIKHVANSWAADRAGNEALGKFITKLRANATAVGIGLRATTVLVHTSGLVYGSEVVGAGHMAKAVENYAAHPIETTRHVLEQSPEVRAHLEHWDQDIQSALARMDTQRPLNKAAAHLDDAQRFMFHGIGWIVQRVSIPTWMAKYNEMIEAGASEEDAKYAAEKAVRQTMGAAGAKDLAAVQRSTGNWGQAVKLFTMFYTQQAAQYQRQRTLARDVMGADARRPRDLPKLAARAFFLIGMAPLWDVAIRYAVAGKGPEDDQSWTEFLLEHVLSNQLAPLPFVRDVFQPTWGAVAGRHMFEPTLSPIEGAYKALTDAAKTAGKQARGEETKHATRDYLTLAGYATGLVPGQVASATQFLVDVSHGDANPQSVRDWAIGLSSGHMPKDH